MNGRTVRFNVRTSHECPDTPPVSASRRAQYGPGTVVESNERHTVIDFDDHGVRRFVTMMVDLKPSTVLAPTKAKRAKASRKR